MSSEGSCPVGAGTRTAYDSYLRASELHAPAGPALRDRGRGVVPGGVPGPRALLLPDRPRPPRRPRHLDADDVDAAAAALRRVAGHFTGLNASWSSLRFMTPRDFQPIKTAMGAAYGRSSSLQSWTYRSMAYLLGLKDAALAEPVAGAETQHAQLLATLGEPSVDDAALGVLARRGLGLPAGYAPVGTVRPAGERAARPEVERAWGTVYDSSPEHTDLVGLADALFAVAEGFLDYRHHHLTATRRTLGRRPAYYGTSGVEWLRAADDDLPFPEMWTLLVPGEQPVERS